ncbi:MAG: AAA family ATPase [Bdellovibrionota bacterium]|nr:AAA family ATPase [Bdellovibrionota bacterium]
MHLKKLKIKNFRKFGESECSLDFVSYDEGSENKVASSTTLIVGKNNTGKTTVTKALNKVLDNSKTIKGSDFNYRYLLKLLEESYSSDEQDYPLPHLEFEFVVVVENNAENRLNNLIEFVDIDNVTAENDVMELTVKLKYEVEEVEKYRNELNKLIRKHDPVFKFSNYVKCPNPEGGHLLKGYRSFLHFKSVVEVRKARLFKAFINLLSQTSFVMNCYGLNGEQVEGKKFNISNLFSLKVINANNNLHDKNLSNIFNKIIKNRYLSEDEISRLEELKDEIEVVNRMISEKVSNDHNKSVNGVLHQIEFHKRLGVSLSANLDFEKVTRDLIKHEYTEQGFFIPEAQFGLGYTKLMNIIGEIIDYVERYPTEGVQSKINLICIEEPEAFMHPQMQESFIKYINNAVTYLLDSSGKNINSQLIITTHSSHILNSKIHCSNSFNNINYITHSENAATVVNLSDCVVTGNESAPGTETKVKNDLKFLKKHIKYKVSELFFADAIIFVEGITEETLLSYYIEQDEALSKFYITILNINGAHGQVYLPLVKNLNIPTLIVTDLDIKREDNEKFEIVETEQGNKRVEIYSQIESLEGRVSTNTTIHKFNGAGADGLSKYFDEDNIYGVFQKDPIEGYYATSFEEAFVLQNYNNEILNTVLESTKPNIYKVV